MKLFLLGLSFLLTIFLGACNRQETFKDLNDYLKKLESHSSSQKKKTENILPQLKTATYQKELSRTPFEEISVPGSSGSVSSNPLRKYPLNLLRFLGTLIEEGRAKAYLMTPDNKIYQVTIGDIIGDHHGKIVRISPGELEVVEQVEEGKPNTQRIVTLQLKEEG